ncbi:hypothetical protein [Prevotella sp.]|uniref:hypothetical protein n=1 Tax=uncultured Prevotella sp. TaxID=159272 RepID=UPI0026361EE0|nr:hypothetical protein [uncultured Prevotella sp.]
MKEYIKPNIKSFDACCESLLAGSLGSTDNLPSKDDGLNQFSKKKGSTSLWDYDDDEEEENN